MGTSGARRQWGNSERLEPALGLPVSATMRCWGGLRMSNSSTLLISMPCSLAVVSLLSAIPIGRDCLVRQGLNHGNNSRAIANRDPLTRNWLRSSVGRADNHQFSGSHTPLSMHSLADSAGREPA
jgi:hypothetical protein